MITAIRFDGVGISALGSMHTGGVAAFPRSAVGFVNALERRLAYQGMSLGQDRRVAVGVEVYRLHAGEKNPTTPKMTLPKPWRSIGAIEGSVLDYELKCNARITLVISTNGKAENEPGALQQAIGAVVPAMRFSNGSIFVKGSFVEVVPGTDGDALEKALRGVRGLRAQYVISRDDLIKTGEEVDSFLSALALFDGTSQAKDEELDSADNGGSGGPIQTRKWYRGQAGWIVPLERGYQAVTRAVVGRPSARDSMVPTIVATPVLGLGEFVSARRLLGNLDAKAFWHSESEREAGFYLFNASSFNG